MENSSPVFSRIGIEDRNMISVLGSMILFIIVFVASQVTYQILKPFKPYSYRIRKVLNYVKVEQAYRTIIIIFFIEAYLDLLLGGFIATENFSYLYQEGMWGVYGSLTVSD